MSEDTVRILKPCQSWDPGRGDFMVHSAPIQGKTKMVNDRRQVVMRSCNHVTDKGGLEAHPYSYKFVVEFA